MILHAYGPCNASMVGVDDGTVEVGITKRKVGVDVGTSVGVLLAVGVSVDVGRRTKVWVAAAPAVWAIKVLIERGSKVGGGTGVAAVAAIGAQASNNANTRNIASIR